MFTLPAHRIALIAILSASILSACGGSDGSAASSAGPTGAPATFTVGGTVAGLGATETVVLRNNGGDDLSVAGNGPFTFRTALATGAAYAVTVFTQPAAKVCAVSGGAGAVAAANVTTVSVACAAPIAIAPVTLPNGAHGVNYAQNITASNGIAPYTFNRVGGQIPPGLLLNANGVLNGIPNAGGRFDFNVQASDSTSPARAALRNYSVLILEVTTKSASNGVEGQPYNQALGVTGEVGTVTWTLAPGSAALPPGLTVQPTGAIGGVPTQGGAFTFDVEATDSDAPRRKTMQRYTARILEVTTAVLPNGTEQRAYSASLDVAGEVGGVAWMLAPGSAPLPPGLTISADGSIQGTPSEDGTFAFTVQATDSDTPARTDRRDLSITIMPFVPVTLFEVVNVLEDGTLEDNIFLNNRVLPSDKQYSASGTGRYVAFTTASGRVLLRDTCKGGAPLSCVPSTRAVSATTGPSTRVRNSPAVSADARWVAFRSTDGLEDPDHVITPGRSQFYVRDTCINAASSCIPRTRLIPERIDGIPDSPRGVTFPHRIGPAISADGRYVLFSVIADAGIAAELTTSGQPAVLVHDRDSDGDGVFDEPGETRNQVVSYRVDGTLFGDNVMDDDFPLEGTMSADGRIVAMVPATRDPVSHIFLHRRDGAFTLDLLDEIEGTASMASLTAPDVSADGTRVAFESSSNTMDHVFLGRRVPQLPSSWLTQAAPAGFVGGFQPPSLSSTGRIVAFSHSSDELGAGNSAATFDVFVWDACTGGTVPCVESLRSVTGQLPDGNPATGGAVAPRLSADGAYVVFISADRLDPNAPDVPGLQRIFIATTGVSE